VCVSVCVYWCLKAFRIAFCVPEILSVYDVESFREKVHYSRDKMRLKKRHDTKCALGQGLSLKGTRCVSLKRGRKTDVNWVS